MWSSNERLGSSNTPRSLVVDAGIKTFHKRDIWKSRRFEISCLLPKTISFVLSGFSKRRLSKKQLRIRKRSLFKSVMAFVRSCVLKEMRSFVSSM